MPDLFLSHASKDDAAINRVAEALETHGLTVWIDHRSGIVPGAPNWDRAIRTAVQESAAGVLVMSPRSLASDVCAAECLLVRELDKPLYVACLDTCQPQEIWLTIKMIQYADLRTDLAAGIAKLVAAIRGTAGTDLPTPVSGKLTGSDVMHANLPYLNTVPLIGRDADLTASRALLDPCSAVVQLIAVGGTGKSRLAAELALSHAEGAIWHRCGETSAAYQVTEGIRQHFRLDEKLKEDEVLAALDTGTPPLIVVDNAESVAAGTPQRAAYVTLLHQLVAHHAPVLLTTRVVWDELKPRREHRLSPISTETAAHVAQEFAHAEDVTLATPDAAILAEACRQHPRLIEFAVRQLHERELPAVIRQVRELKHHDVQEALDEMILQTVRQMAAQVRNGPDAETLLACLTVLRGPFDRTAVLALKPDDMTEDTADDALITLQRWGFVGRDPSSGSLRIDEVVSGAVSPADGAAARHFAHYLSQHGDYDANNNEDRHPHIQADWPNIRAALDWGFAQQPEQAVDWAFALHYFMQMRALWAEWRAVLTTAQTAAQRIDYALGQANTQKALGDVARMQNDYAAARVAYGAAMPLYEAIGDRLGQANTQKALGDVARMQNDYAAARVAYGAAMPLYEAIGARLGQANTLQALGDVAYMEDDYAAARVAYGAAMPLYEAIGDRLGQANTQKALGDVAYMEDDYAAARVAYGAAMPLYEAIGDRLGQANTQKALGDVALAQNDYAAARVAYGAAMPLYEAIGARLGQANTLQALGDVAYMEDDYAAARVAYGAAMPLYEAIGDRLGQANTQKALGDVARMQNDYAAARVAYGAAMPLYEAIGDRLGQANTQKALGDVARMQNDYAAARVAYGAAMPLYEAIGDRLGQANTQKALGDVALAQNDYAAARAAYGAAMPLYEAIGDRLGQANTQKALGDVARMQNDYAAARVAYQQALALGSQIGDFTSRLNSLYGLVRLEKAEGNREAARDYYGQLMALAASHPFFANHPVVEGWRQEFADLAWMDNNKQSGMDTKFAAFDKTAGE